VAGAAWDVGASEGVGGALGRLEMPWSLRLDPGAEAVGSMVVCRRGSAPSVRLEVAPLPSTREALV